MSYSKTAEINLAIKNDINNVCMSAITSNYYYIVTQVGNLHKINLSSFTVEDTLNLFFAEADLDDNTLRLSLSPDSSFLIVAYGSKFKGYLIKVDLTTFSVTYTYSDYSIRYLRSAIIGHGNYTYISGTTYSPTLNKTYRFLNSDMSYVDAISNPGNGWMNNFTRGASPYIYGYYSGGGPPTYPPPYYRIYRLNESSFSYDLYSAELPVYLDMAVNSENNYLYGAGQDTTEWDHPAIFKITLPDLSSFSYKIFTEFAGKSFNGCTLSSSKLFCWSYSYPYSLYILNIDTFAIEQEIENAQILEGRIQESNQCFLGLKWLVDVPGMQTAVKYCGAELPISSILFLDEEPIILI